VIAVACSTRCFPLETPSRALARVAWAGFRAAEVTWSREEELSEEGLQERLNAEELSLVALDAGVAAASSAEAAMEAAAHVGRCAVLARALGAPGVILQAPAAGEGSLDHLAYGLSRLVPALREVPVLLCMRLAQGSLVATPDDLLALCRKADAAALPASEPRPSSRLRLALDPADLALAGGSPSNALTAALLPQAEVPLGHVYLTDCRAGTRVAPGTGELDWGELSALLLSGGYEGSVVVLLEGVDPLFAEGEAKEAAAFAHALFPDAILAPDIGR
jgi:sugar phosphate isomerase/epimerase